MQFLKGTFSIILKKIKIKYDKYLKLIVACSKQNSPLTSNNSSALFAGNCINVFSLKNGYPFFDEHTSILFPTNKADELIPVSGEFCLETY